VSGVQIFCRTCVHDYLAAGLLGLCLAASAAGADGFGGSCTWGPITNVPAAQGLLRQWAAAANLPPFDKDKSGFGIDRSNARLMLQFAQGTLTVAWKLDKNCRPTAVTIAPSPDYQGPRPDEGAVQQLVASLRTVTVEQRIGARWPTFRELWSSVFSARGGLVVVALGVVFAGVLFLARRRSGAAGMAPGEAARRVFAQFRGMPASSRIRLLGVLGIVALLPYQPLPPGPGSMSDWLDANAVVLIGVLPFITFLWLAVSGGFGYGSPTREDWPALVPFVLALGLREGWARHGIQDVEVYFFWGQFSRHSVLHTLLQMFLQPLAPGDPFRFMTHVNGVLGAVATLPLYLFVRQRTGLRMAGLVVATLFAVHPAIVTIAPTDASYSLLLACWFSGLALLSAPSPGPRALVGGATLLGIAATCRGEGELYLIASLLLLDVGALLASVRHHQRAAAAAAAAVIGLVSLHIYACFWHHIPPGQHLPNIGSVHPWDVVRGVLFSYDFNDPAFVPLVGVGALAGVVSARFRIGLGAVLGAAIVIVPVSMTTSGGYAVLHRVVPTCALEVIAAGIAIAAIAMLLPARLRDPAAGLATVALAVRLFVVSHAQMHDPNALTEEFWMLRDHLAPGGHVTKGCTLLSFGKRMDVDVHDMVQVLPGMNVVHCEDHDCRGPAAAGGCVYWVRSLACFHDDVETKPACAERGQTADGGVLPCLEPRCAEIERSLDLSPVDERTVDVRAVWSFAPAAEHFPATVQIGLYRVRGVRP
jgi:hypothetical protein